MKVAEMKKAIENLTDEAEVVLVGWDKEKSRDIKKTTHQCANFEHQESRNELWLSLEGFFIAHSDES